MVAAPEDGNDPEALPYELEQEDDDQGKIENPWHSRPIDVHRWSDHSELVAVVGNIWDTHFGELDQPGKSGPKPKQSFQNQLRVLILDLYVAWLEDPNLSIGVALSENAWDTGSRYNALHISKKIIPLVHGLDEAGLIDLAKGSYGGKKAMGNRTTRIRAAERLRAMFRGANVTRDDVQQVESQECVILKAGEGDAAKVVEYEDTPETNDMRQELLAYNALLVRTFIDIPTLEDPWVTRQDRWGREVSVQIDPHHQFVRRIFSRGDWGCNGRFYGPWWQQVNKELRKQIFINDTPTVEVDFKGLHVMILSAEKGVVIEGDPYELPAGLVPGAPAALQRNLIKRLVLTALNARNNLAAFSSFREGFPAGHMAKGMTNEELEALLGAFTAKHPHLSDRLCADQGIRLMNIDGKIAAVVQNYMTLKGIPVLSVHDSFIVDYTHVKLLRRAMQFASKLVVGRELPVDANGLGLDEVNFPPDAQQHFKWWRQLPREQGYLARVKNWEKRKGREVVPY